MIIFGIYNSYLADHEVSQFAQLSSDAYMIFSVNIPEDGVYPVTLFAYACESKVLSSLFLFSSIFSKEIYLFI